MSGEGAGILDAAIDDLAVAIQSRSGLYPQASELLKTRTHKPMGIDGCAGHYLGSFSRTADAVQ